MIINSLAGSLAGALIRSFDPMAISLVVVLISEIFAFIPKISMPANQRVEDNDSSWC